jgi:broad specificity phosphatase PhoE
MAVKAIFVRHSESTGNAQDIVKGTRDYPTDRRGKIESKALATRVARFKPTVVVSSPLSRATEPARAIAKKAGVKLIIDKGLLPQDFGDLTGTPRATGEPKIRRAALEHPSEPLPGGESFREWDGKNTAAMQRVARRIKAGERPAVVTHSRNLRELGHALLGDRVADPTRGGPSPAGFVTLEGKRKLRMHRSVS